MAVPASFGRELSSYLPPPGVAAVEEAYTFSERAHQGQKRQSGQPYISHPLAVARILAEWKLDANAIIAALLHDAVEDTDVTLEQIRAQFNGDVARMVDGVTKIDQLDQKLDKSEQDGANFRKMLLAVADDWRVVLIKLADRLHNMRTLSAMAAPKRRRISEETLRIHAPIADRLGLSAVKDELENLAFAHRHPHRHRILSRALKNSARANSAVIAKIFSRLQSALAAANLKVEARHRQKNLYSIYRKMIEERLSFAEVEDIAGFRIITQSRLDCYVALGVAHEIFQPIPGKFSDYIATPKSNGYQSLHTKLLSPEGVKIEIQIRSQAIHEAAEHGMAAHWLYRQGEEGISRAQREALQRLSGLIKLQSENSANREFLEHAQVDLFPDEVYALTPNGKIVALPHGACALDFAYAIHTDLGDRAQGAKINGRAMPISAKLKNGDTVEIASDKGGAPMPHWLGYVKTAKARSHIRAALRNTGQDEAAALGRRLLHRAAAKIGVDNVDALGKESWRECLAANNMNEKRDLYVAIGLGKVLADIAARALARRAAKQTRADSAPALAPVAIAGAANTAVRISSCCQPLPFEPIVGFLRKDLGLIVHAADCAAIHGLNKRSEKWVEVAWGEDAEKRFYLLDLRLSCHNGPGLMSAVARAISDMGINIVSCHFVHAQSESKFMEMDLSVQISGAQEREKLRRHLLGLSDIRSVRQLKGNE